MNHTQVRRAARALLATGLLAAALVTTGGGAAAQSISPGPTFPNPPLHLDWRPDLTISMTDAPDPVSAGQNFTYTLTVRNAPVLTINGQPMGPSAQWVQVRQIVPQGVSVQSVSATNGFQCVPNTMNVICQGGPIAAGGSVTITVQARAPLNPGYTWGGHIVSTATVDTWNLIAERNESNNSATADTLIPLNSFF